MSNGGVSDGGLHKNEQFSSAANVSGIVKYWPFKDYTNFIVKDFTDLDRPYQGKGQLGQCCRVRQVGEEFYQLILYGS